MLIILLQRCIHRILGMLVSKPFYSKYVAHATPTTPPEIRENPKWHPFFEHCLEALDGSHFHAWVLEHLMARYRNRKGGITQNVLASCDWKMRFNFILAGWEGSAADSHIFECARETSFVIPDGWYYLADAGFPLCDALLVPYQGKCYHLKEWGRANQK
jgi:hypothetical protein